MQRVAAPREAVVAIAFAIKSGWAYAQREQIALSVPLEAAKELPELAAQVQDSERGLIRICLGGNFSIERLAEEIRRHTEEYERPRVRRSHHNSKSF